MSNFSKLQLDNVIYNVKDEEARNNIQELNNNLNSSINSVNQNINSVNENLSNEINTTKENINNELNTINESIPTINPVIKPEDFGAIGDGVTDDSDAFISMIAYVDSIVPTKTYINEASCKDYSNVSFQFSRRYAISKPITFDNVYGLDLNNLKLTATSNFEGDYLLGFKNPTRQINVNSCYLNGNLKAPKCLHVQDYTLGLKIDNCEITRFLNYGIYMTNKGHETIISNTKINQVEWGEKDNINELVNYGVGLFLDTERYDNHFINMIINYCHDNTMIVKSGANYFNQCHFYGTPVDIQGSYNYINNCYFDTTQLLMYGFNYVRGCNFSGRGVNDNFIIMSDHYSSRWKYNYSIISDCIFRCEEPTLNNPIGFNPDWEETDSFTIQTANNSFYNVKFFNYQSPYEYYPAPYKAMEYTGNSENGTVRIGDFSIQWGTITQEQAGAGYIFFNKPFDGYEVNVFITPQYTETEGIPFANDINNQRFWANGVHGTCKWVAIGRMNYR